MAFRNCESVFGIAPARNCELCSLIISLMNLTGARTLMTQTHPWHPADIKAAIHKSGSTMTAIALAAGLHPSGLSQALRWPIPPANRAIADHLQVPLHELWPDWYGADGELLPGVSKAREIRAARHRQKEAAA